MARVLSGLPCKPRYILLAVAVHGLLIWTVVKQWAPQPMTLPAMQPVMEISLAPAPPVPSPPPVAKPEPPPEPIPPPVVEPEPPAPVQREVPPKPVEPPKPPPKPVKEKRRPEPPKRSTPRPVTPPREQAPENPPARVNTQPTKAPSAPAVTQPVFDAAYLNNPPPEYPRLARRAHQQGTVMLNVMVSAAGTASEVNVAQSSGSDALDDAALRAVKRWRFVPAKRGSEPVAGWVRVPVVFRLDG